MEKKYLGVMLDCSRNAVMNMPTVKRYMDMLKKMGYNMLMLYTEDTYEVDGHPQFGYLRGRYSKDDMKEIVAYGEKIGMELIPCIQTLAHLNQLMRWNRYRELRDDGPILLIDDDRTYELIESMFKSLRECYKTDKIHIGMDEAHMVGLGRYLDQHGFVNRFELLSRHLKKVSDLAVKYGFKPLMWSDMFFRLANKGAYYAGGPEIITEDIIKLVPENVELVYWDYYNETLEKYSDMVEAHKKFNNPIWFAGGAWLWGNFTPQNRISMRRNEMAIKTCIEKGVDNVLITCWGDDGAEASAFSVLPTLFRAAENYRGNYDMESIKAKFEKMFGIAFDDYLKLDLPSVVDEFTEQHLSAADKQVLYNDIFLGVYDSEYANEKGEEKVKAFAKHSSMLLEHADNKEFGLMFKTAAALCDLCSVKATLGNEVLDGYSTKNMDKLKDVIERIKVTEEKVEKFYLLYREFWMSEKRPHGFDIQDIRIGGVKLRLRSCRERLEDFVAGKIDRIDELDEKRLNLSPGCAIFNWQSVSVNALTGGVNYF